MAEHDPRPPEPAARGLDLFGRPLPEPRLVNAPFGPSPPRRLGSIRRTMSIDMTWPGADPSPVDFDGRARDIRTRALNRPPELLAEDRITGRLAERVIVDVAGGPPGTDLTPLVGERAGSNLRGAIDRLLHDARVAAAPLYLLLDDLAGASLVATWGWSRSDPEGLARRMRDAEGQIRIDAMAGVCIGFRPGSAALNPHAHDGDRPNTAAVPAMPDPADPAGWHALPDNTGRPAFRRSRVVDIWRADGLLHAESVFQDSASLGDDADRAAIHEYRLVATADAATGTLLSLDATPGTLPHAECPAATRNIQSLVGVPMASLREAVLERLRRTSGCTHLNDMVRSLAEVPVLAGYLAD